MMKNLIVISHEFDVENEIVLVNELFNEGMDLFHLKKPVWDEDSQRHFLEKINPGFLSRISVHQHHHTAAEFGLQFMHVRERDRIKNNYNNVPGIAKSTSFHNYEELKKQDGQWEYCFLSPVFDSISKKNYPGKFADLIVDQDLRTKVYALGGIQADNITTALEHGFYGAVISGAIWLDGENALKNFREISSKCNRSAHMY